ncbi:Lrp/AsnC family transcriptional regulator [Natronorubrum daqingense]|uniref:AsnC family transcriptional regulator n=1 Tax=Natronorubrum daqingense TaxID=588898 RepID=A0A1N7F7V3_9EURY|nr:Lrp/AsnC family transcriptional regulator [Natronorubrum daqingense]APX97591.1 AsnC family transcriptional regulator [Natronorubrum daqingense]SIR96342.1 DNA-binding transcriptional regulator, Lrp family [Natronorubrum daqingense]
MRNRATNSGYQLDEVDRRVIYELMTDARGNSSPAIAEEIDVSPGTVRNRIEDLEEHGVIDGYHAHIDFEATDGRLSTLFMCSVPFADRKTAARAADEIPGVVNVRILMGGRRNFHVLAVGEDTDDLRRIGTTLSELGVEIEDEMLVENDKVRPYEPFGPDGSRQSLPTDFISLSGDSEVVEITVRPDAPIAGATISDAANDGHLEDNPLIVAITRDDELLTPHGDTTIQPDDIVTVFSNGGVSDETVQAFVETDARGVTP